VWIAGANGLAVFGTVADQPISRPPGIIPKKILWITNQRQAAFKRYIKKTRR
jgi:hypothetical protein